jgi:hypothetical protein
MYPFDLALTNRVAQAAEAIPDDAVNPFDPSRDKDFRKLFRHCSGHAFLAK